MNKFFKVLLVATSISPILFTYWFVEQVDKWNDNLDFFENIICDWNAGIGYLAAAFGLVLIFLIIIRLSKNRLEILNVSIEEIKTADNETISFVIIYLLPLANNVSDSFNLPILLFIAIFFFFIVLSTNSYHFNPLINLFGFHFYEVKVRGGITYVLLSKKNVTNSKSINKVQQLTEYMIIEKT